MTPDFILTNTRAGQVPLTPEITLRLADDPIALWEQTGDEPPFWAFAWAGGQALARHVLDHPDLVAGCRVLDLAAGSGLVAIAAALAGASEVTAVDIDPLAMTVTALNAQANDVRVHTRQADILDELVTEDVVLAGDVCYDKPMAARMLAFLTRAAGTARAVLIGDPGRAHFPRTGLTPLATYQVPATHSLEAEGITATTVWRF